jgi:protein SCO1
MSDQIAQPTPPQQSRLVLLGTLLVGIAGIFVVLYALISGAERTGSTADTGSALIEGQPYTGITTYSPARPLKDFSLVSQSGKPVSLSDFQGKLSILYFGYINCPDVCQATMLNFKQIRLLLEDHAEKVNFVFISVDPQRDTPTVIGEYVAQFDPAITGLAGDFEVFEQIKADYNLEFIELPVEGSASAKEYLISHTSDLFLADASGNLVAIYTTGIEARIVADDLLKRLERQS